MPAQLSLWLCLALHALFQPFSTPSADPHLHRLSSARSVSIPEKSPASSTFSAPGAFPCLTGIINDYTPVLGFGCDSSTLNVGTLTGFAAGDKVLLLQMQVPQVDLSNTASFGTLLNSTCIGNYEFNRIQSIGGGTVQLKYALTRSYDLSGKVQLVRVPEYDSVIICSLTCLPWNGSIGGVLALDVKGQLTLSGNIDVSGKGFRGGNVDQDPTIAWVFGETQYTYSPQPSLSAEKGEGIVMIPTGYSFGRGCAGNGGGGGNAHNAGGGGGANAGAGGDGGLEILNLPAPPVFNTNGIGGTKYFDNDVNKVLLGGGAGAGHANDGRGSSGGTGGGIAFILANTLQTNNFRIRSNGIDVIGGFNQNDGQGGGGAGGTVVLKVGQLNGTLPCDLKGGSGGSNPYFNDSQLHGPGGGGGGGKLLLAQNLPGIIPSLQGGVNGLTSQNFSNGAAPGEMGKILAGFALPEGTKPTHPVSNQMVLAVQSSPCLGMNNGQISVLQSTALAFRINAGAWQTDSVFTGLASGSYQISLQFSGGCTFDTTAVLVATPPLYDSLLLITTPTCTGGGSLSVVAVSGTAPIEYQLNNNPWQNNGTFNNLSPGTYTVRLRDAAGCTDVDMYTVAAPLLVRDSLLSLTNAGCTLGGSITVTAVAGLAPFQFQLNSDPWQANGIFNNLSPGSYIITTRDAAGCTYTSTYTIVMKPPALDSLIALTSAGCTVGGSITVAAVSGTAPFQFQLNNGPWQANGSFNNLSPGAYAITIRDAAGCTHTTSYTIARKPPALDSLVSLSNAGCAFGGSIGVVAVSGTAPFEFQINSGPWQANGNFYNLPPGLYTITLRDSAGCTHISRYSVAPPRVVRDSLLSLTDAGCTFGGTITAIALSGIVPFEFQINGGPWQSNSNFSDLPPGSYTVTLRDAAGCTDSSTYLIAAPSSVRDSLIAVVGAGCNFGGSLAVSAVAGTPPFEFQLNNGPWQATGNFSDLTSGDYTITLRDSVGCTHVSTYTVDASPPVLDSLLSSVSAGCTFGGSIAVDAISGTPPFEFQLESGPWQANGNFIDLPPGDYNITIRDSAGCIHTSTYSVATPPPVLDSLLSSIKAGCTFGGSLAVAAISGTQPFEFQLNNDPWQANGNFADLTPGDYTITLRDSAGCTHTSTYAVAAPPPVLDSLLFVVSAGCTFGGSITVAAISGTPFFDFQLNNGPWQTNGDFTDLSAGDYTITLRDSAGCTHTSNYAVPSLAPVLDSLISLVGAGCSFGGSIATAAVAGTQPFEFQLDSGPWQASGHFTDLPPGDYTVTLRDSAGCTHLSTYAVAAPPPVLDSLLSSVSAGCTFGGSLAVAAISGTQPFEFQLNSGPWQTNGIFAGLLPDTYNITLRDSAGCIHTSNYAVAAPPPALDSLLSSVSAGCTFGGSLTVNAISGTQPFEFQLNSGPWQTNGVFAGLLAGDYTINLRDSAGCTHTSNYTVTPPPPALDSLLALTTAGCTFGGSINIAAISGTQPFEFQLNSGPWQTNGGFAGLLPGDYTITLRDSAGCTHTSNYSVASPPPALDSLISLVNAGCTFGGSITIAATSGTQPFEFQLNNEPWQATGVFPDLLPGIYNITLRDSAGCIHTNNYTVVPPPPALDSLISLVNAGCTFGGSINIAAISGTQPFEFQLDSSSWQSNGIFANLLPGAYNITLRDSAGCTHTSHYSVAGPPPVLDSLISIVNAGCTFGGSIATTAISGTQPFDYQINGGPWQASGSFTNLSPGDYDITLRDSAGCIHTSIYSVAAPPNALDSLISLSDAGCTFGGKIEVAPISGTPPFEFRLNNEGWQASGVFADLPSGTYIVALQDAVGCTHKSTYTVAAPPSILDSLVSLTNPDCHQKGSFTIAAVSGTAPFQFQLNNGPLQPSGSFTDLLSGNYTVTLRDAAGCSHIGTYTIALYEPLMLRLDSLIVVDCRHPLGSLTVTASGGFKPYSYRLGNGPGEQSDGYFPDLLPDLYSILVTDSTGCTIKMSGLSIVNLIDTVVTRETVTIYEGSYFELPDGRRVGQAGQFSFAGQTTEGCDSLHIIDIIVLERHVYVPNIFHPNDDGDNDFLTVFSDASLAVVRRLAVYDRWGELIFEKRDMPPNQEREGWDGQFRGRLVNAGVFVWVAELEFVDGWKRTIWGDVTVVR